MTHRTPLLFRVAGPSNSGKTTWILELVRQLQEANLNVATIKHSHHKLDVLSRKDGHKLGAIAPNITVGKDRIILDQPLTETANLFALTQHYYSDMDVVLIEGWRRENLPTLLIADPPTDWVVPEGVIARTTNVVSETFNAMPVWEIDDVVDWVLNRDQ